MDKRHPNIVNVEDFPWNEPLTPQYTGQDKRVGLRDKWLAYHAGGEQLGCSIYLLPPGERGFPFHYHLVEEEAIFVLEGEATLRLGDREIPVRAGDYVTFPVGPAHAHQLINTSSAPLYYLGLSTCIEPELAGQPDSKKIGILGGSISRDANGQPLRQLVRQGESLNYFDGEDD